MPRVNDLSQRLAAVFLKNFFAPKQVAEIKRLEEAIWDTWKTDPGKILRRCGYSLQKEGNGEREELWRFFFVKELRFKWVEGWQRLPEGRKFAKTIKRYRAYRIRLARLLNPTGARIRVEGESSPLQTALADIKF